jgi:hypothetical protein
MTENTAQVAGPADAFSPDNVVLALVLAWRYIGATRPAPTVRLVLLALAYYRPNSCSAQEIAGMIGCTTGHTESALRQLLKQGVIKRARLGRNACWAFSAEGCGERQPQNWLDRR